MKNTKTELRTERNGEQGDQIVRIIAFWVILYTGQLYENERSGRISFY
jgi:hypothetical protein